MKCMKTLVKNLLKKEPPQEPPSLGAFLRQLHSVLLKAEFLSQWNHSMMSPTSVPHHPHALGQLSHGVDQADGHDGPRFRLSTHALVQQWLS